MRVLALGLFVLSAGRCWGESGCFRSVGEAARAAGIRDEGGFRAEGVRRDPLSGVEWVKVIRCGRPEMPGVLVRASGLVPAQLRREEAAVGGGHTGSGGHAEAATRPMVVAGDAVRVVWEEGAAKGQLAGVAVVSGAVGARVRVRVEGFAKSAEERFVAGVVRAAGLVELERGWEVAR